MLYLMGFEPVSLCHADLIPSTVGIRILQAMPWSIRLKTVGSALIGRGKSSLVTFLNV